MRTVAALYIDPRGPYPKLEDVDCYDETRDARLYNGPHPVVAHPPCGPWGRLSLFCTKQDKACGLRAVEQVRANGGVLEHPEWSRLFEVCDLPRPGWMPDEYGGRTYGVDQVGWGHKCRKRTWLYVVRVKPYVLEESMVKTMDPYAEATAVVRGPSLLPDLPKSKRHITPLPFAEWLVFLARSAS